MSIYCSQKFSITSAKTRAEILSRASTNQSNRLLNNEIVQCLTYLKKIKGFPGSAELRLAIGSGADSSRAA